MVKTRAIRIQPRVLVNEITNGFLDTWNSVEMYARNDLPTFASPRSMSFDAPLDVLSVLIERS